MSPSRRQSDPDPSDHQPAAAAETRASASRAEPEASAPARTREQRVELGRLIERLRLERGLRFKSNAADACNLSDSHWGALERGYKYIDKDGQEVPAELKDGDALKIVWGLGLSPSEQTQLFTAAGFDHLIPRPVPPRDELLKPEILEGVLTRYSADELQRFEDAVALKRFEQQGRVRRLDPRAARETGEVLAREGGETGEVDADDVQGPAQDLPDRGHAGPGSPPRRRGPA
jgi:hypothetical protein